MKHRILCFLKCYRFPLLVGLGLRVISSLWLAAVWYRVEPFVLYNEKLIHETYNHLPVDQSLLGQMFLGVWLRWDGVHYMNLAWGGYAGAGAADMNYWPLYPYLVRLLSPLLGGQIVLTGLLVSTLATLLAMVLFCKLVRDLFHDEALANGSVLAWAVFPTSFFLVAPFTDSLFACLALASLLLMQQRRWLLAGLAAALAGLARSQGILLVFPMLLALALDGWQRCREPWRQDWRRSRRFCRDFRWQAAAPPLLGLAVAPAGTALFFLWRALVGLPNILSSFNTYTHARFVDPLSAIVLAAAQLVRAPDLLQVTELGSVLLFLAVQCWMLTRPLFRRALPLMSYGLLNILFNLMKHIENSTPLQSSNRYVLNVLPAFIGLAYLTLRLRPNVRKWVVTLSAAAGLVSGALYALWIFVG